MASKYTPAAKEDTYRLIAKAQSGDRAAREQVVAQNIGLVKNLALKYTSAYYETEDRSGIRRDVFDLCGPHDIR